MGDFYRLDCGHDLAEGETIADPCPTCRLIAKVRREALEEAARVAEVYQDPRGYGDYASDVITARIRALKEKDGRRHPCAEGGTGMSDDLVKRLRAGTGDGLRAWDWMNEAADRIEELEEEVRAQRVLAVAGYEAGKERIEELERERERDYDMPSLDAIHQMIGDARREALEEAARVAEVYQDPRGYGDYASDVITARIRALKEKE